MVAAKAKLFCFLTQNLNYTVLFLLIVENLVKQKSFAFAATTSCYFPPLAVTELVCLIRCMPNYEDVITVSMSHNDRKMMIIEFTLARGCTACGMKSGGQRPQIEFLS